jgi:hypothetical protein
MQVKVSLKQCLRKDNEEIQNKQFLAFKMIKKNFFLYAFIYELMEKTAPTASDDLLLSPLSEHMQNGAPPEEARSAHPNSSPIGKV